MFTIPHDKALHFVYGTLIFVAAFIAATVAGLHGPLAASAFVAGVAVGKEVKDCWQNRAAKKAGLLPPHSVEFLDILWTVAPAILFNVCLAVSN
jgi:Kef-type K+ transport system membrane component KefB